MHTKLVQNQNDICLYNKRSPSDREKAINIEHNDKMTTTSLLDHIQNYIELYLTTVIF